jgi:transposase-like protein
MGHKAKHKSEKEMFSIVKSCIDSGNSRREFCQQQGISKATFYNWYKKYKDSELKSPERFIPVKVIVPGSRQNATDNRPVIEINYPNGVRLNLQGTTDISFIRSLVGVI